MIRVCFFEDCFGAISHFFFRLVASKRGRRACGGRMFFGLSDHFSKLANI